MKHLMMLVVMLALAVGAGHADQLVNGNFEGSDVSCWGNPPASWSGYGTWPKVFDGRCPFSDLNDAPDGLKFAGESWSYGSTKTGGIYQQITCNPSSTGTFRAMWAVYNNSSSIQLRVGIDPAGGTDPNAASVVWSAMLSWDAGRNGNFPTAAGWGIPSATDAWIETPQITSIGKKVTCFIDYYAQPGPGGLIGFDAAQVTGALADAAVLTYPPSIRNLSRSTPATVGNVSFSYQMFEPNDMPGDYTDPSASLLGMNGGFHPDYRVGGVFNTASMPPGFAFDVQPYQYTMCATETQGITPLPGMGTMFVRGLGYRTDNQTAEHFLWRDVETAPEIWEKKRNSPNLVAVPLGMTGQSLRVVAKFTNWRDSANEFNPIVQDWEGAALYMATTDKQYFFSVGAFQDPGPFNTATWVSSLWCTDGVHNGFQNSYTNIQPAPIGNGVTNPPLWVALQHIVDGSGERVIASLSRVSGEIADMQAFHTFDLAGTGLGGGVPLQWGFYINEGLICNIDSMITGWRPCTNGPGGDGATNLVCTPPGDAHTYVWNALDLEDFCFFSQLSTQLRFQGADLDGPGPAVLNDWENYSGCQQPTATFTPDATNTPTVTSTPQCCLGDADKNQFVNGLDYASVRDHFGENNPAGGLGDADCDNFVGPTDYRVVRDHFGEPCTP